MQHRANATLNFAICSLNSQAGVCLISFLAALVFTLGSGNYWLEIFNSYVGSVPLLIIAFFELIGVTYFHGIQK